MQGASFAIPLALASGTSNADSGITAAKHPVSDRAKTVYELSAKQGAFERAAAEIVYHAVKSHCSDNFDLGAGIDDILKGS